jgi:hypothetical protein
MEATSYTFLLKDHLFAYIRFVNKCTTYFVTVPKYDAAGNTGIINVKLKKIESKDLAVV